MKGDANLSNKQAEEGNQNSDQEEIIVDPDWNETVTQDKIKDAWLLYARRIQKTNPRLASILNNHIPELKSGTILSVKLKNVTQENELKEQKTVMFPFLKRELQNAALELETDVVIEGQKGNKAFTAAEKAKLMAKKNPALLLLTKKFDLDVQ